MSTPRRLVSSGLALTLLPLAACSAGSAAAPAPDTTSAASPAPAASTPASTGSITPSPTTRVSPPTPAVDCRAKKCLALTFDDGPGPYTDQILDALVKHHARATFYVLGQQAKVFPAVLKREQRLAMAIGDHSWSHRDLSRATLPKATEELSSTAELIRRITGSAPTSIRPPYGAYRKNTPHIGLPFILWDVDTLDWKHRSTSRTTHLALAGAHRGAIILMHDIHPSTAQAVPGIITTLQAKGYTLVTVPELLGPMSPDGVYFSAAPQGIAKPPSTRPTPTARRR